MLIKTEGLSSFGAHKATGYAVWSDGTECDTFTCWHCNTVVMVPTKQAELVLFKPGEALPHGHCLLCQRPICATCADAGSCTPFERKLDQIEARDRFLRSAGLA